MQGSYNLTMVLASYCVAVIAAYSAIYFGTRLFSLTGPARKFWLWGGALCLGSGIWSMHFVGMSAYSMPMGMEMSFSAPLTFLSWVPAVLASALALYVITLEKVSAVSVCVSAMVMGAGICAMHYGGMYAMQMDPAIRYDPLLFTVSVVIAVIASGAALVICRQVRRVPSRYQLATKLAASLVMGAAIAGMHYTGMAAAIYPTGAAMDVGNQLYGNWMGYPTAVIAGLFLLVALVAALQDFRHAERQQRERVVRDAQILDAAYKDQTTNFVKGQRFDHLLSRKIARNPENDQFDLLYLELSRYAELVADQGKQAAEELVQDFASALNIYISEATNFARMTGSSFIVLTPPIDEARLKSLLAGVKEHVGRNRHAKRYGAWTLGYSRYPDSTTNNRLLIKAAQRIRHAVDYAESTRSAA